MQRIVRSQTISKMNNIMVFDLYRENNVHREGFKALPPVADGRTYVQIGPFTNSRRVPNSRENQQDV